MVLSMSVSIGSSLPYIMSMETLRLFCKILISICISILSFWICFDFVLVVFLLSVDKAGLTIASAITKVATHAALIGVPINYGEFGVGRTSNSATRNSIVVLEYYKTIKTTCIANNMSFSVWDDRGWFGLITSANQTNYTFSNNIVSTMLAP